MLVLKEDFNGETYFGNAGTLKGTQQ
jgi:hypothetical protein